MKDKKLNASLDSAKLIARSEASKTIRRVQFKLSKAFDLEDATWLGDDALSMREMVVDGTLKKFEIPIDAYHAKATFAGMAGNAEADLDGLTAVVSVKKAKDDDHDDSYELTIGFEAFPKDKLLTWMAASIGEYVDVELMRTQLEVGDKVEKAGKKAVENMQKAIPKGSNMTIEAVIGGKVFSATLEGTGEA